MQIEKPKGLHNRPERADIARRMRREHGEMLRANEQEDHLLRRLVRDHLAGVVVAASAVGALTWYHGGVPTRLQIAALTALVVGLPVARWWARRRRAA